MSNRPSEEWPRVQSADITPTILVQKKSWTVYLLKLNQVFM